jgi:hypothetical protein
MSRPERAARSSLAHISPAMRLSDVAGLAGAAITEARCDFNVEEAEDGDDEKVRNRAAPLRFGFMALRRSLSDRFAGGGAKRTVGTLGRCRGGGGSAPSQ